VRPEIVVSYSYNVWFQYAVIQRKHNLVWAQSIRSIYIYIVGWAIFSNVDAVLSFSFYYVKRAFIFIKWNIRIIFYIINIQDVV